MIDNMSNIELTEFTENILYAIVFYLYYLKIIASKLVSMIGKERQAFFLLMVQKGG